MFYGKVDSFFVDSKWETTITKAGICTIIVLPLIPWWIWRKPFWVLVMSTIYELHAILDSRVMTSISKTLVHSLQVQSINCLWFDSIITIVAFRTTLSRRTYITEYMYTYCKWNLFSSIKQKPKTVHTM